MAYDPSIHDPGIRALSAEQEAQRYAAALRRIIERDMSPADVEIARKALGE